jgi:hypothetical protein
MTRHDSSESVEIPEEETAPFQAIQSHRVCCDCSESNEIILQHCIKHKRVYYRALNVFGITTVALFFMAFILMFIYLVIYAYQQQLNRDSGHGVI